MAIDSGRPFTYVFEDPSWISKVLIGGLLSITLVMLPSMIGYEIDTARRVRDGADIPLPEWGEDFGGRWLRGLIILLVLLIWNLVPALIIACLAGAVGGGLAATSGSNSGAEGVMTATTLVGNCLSIPLSLFTAFVGPAIMSNYVNRGSFGSGFEFGRIWAIMSRNWGTYLLLAVLYYVASLIAGLGVIACFIGIIFTAPYAGLIAAHLIGQLSRPENQPGGLAADAI